MYFFESAQWIKIKGKMSTVSEAPILVVAPHSCLYDSLVSFIAGPAAGFTEIDSKKAPLYGSKF